MNSLPKVVEIFIDGVPVPAVVGSTILQVCLSSKVEVPRFCYHDKLSIAGNCRMCLVEVEKSPKLVASCAMPITQGMRVFTNSNIVRKAREGVLEFLLINHPLDCPICDQGGECDLQDQAMIYGSDRGRFHEFKRSVKDKNLGPLVKTIMTRCIHCTRCVRFSSEVAGVQDLGTTGRGGATEITTYIKKLWLESYLSGNVIDLCPVGALTSKPYAFKARPWELKHTETIDVLDSMGSNIRIDSTVVEVLRVLPRMNESLNGEWITDKTRFSYDGLKKQRLLHPLEKHDVTGQYSQISWEDAFSRISNKINSSTKMSYLVGDLVDLRSAWMLKTFMNYFTSTKNVTNFSNFRLDLRNKFKFNIKLSESFGKENVFLLGAFPQIELPLLFQRYSKKTKFYHIGSFVKQSLTPNLVHLGFSSTTLRNLVLGKNVFLFNSILSSFQFIMGTSLGQNQIFSRYFNSILNQLSCLSLFASKFQDIFNSLEITASSVGLSELGISNVASNVFDVSSDLKSHVDFLYLLGFDQPLGSITSNFIVYHGHHGDIGASNANLVLPGVPYSEKDAVYINVEGLVQKTKKVLKAPTFEEFDILLSLYLYVNPTSKDLNFNQISDFRDSENFKALLNFFENYISSKIPSYTSVGNYLSSIVTVPEISARFSIFSNVQISSPISNFYESNVISRASEIMAKCSLLKRSQEFQTF